MCKKVIASLIVSLLVAVAAGQGASAQPAAEQAADSPPREVEGNARAPEESKPVEATQAESLPTETADPSAQSGIAPSAADEGDGEPAAKAEGASSDDGATGAGKGAPGGEAGSGKGTVEEDLYPIDDLDDQSYWLPATAAGGLNDHVDWMFYAILGLSIFCFVAITAAVVYLTWRYRARPGHKRESSRHHDNLLEVTWTIIPSIICVLIFIGGWKGYLSMNTAPGNALEINVVGVKWNWTMSYQKGQETVQRPELHVPVDTPVKLVMRSEDVLHDFYIPAFRVKRDVIPNRYTYLWFEADTPGVYRVYCAEYCGDSHSNMKTKVIVHEPGGFQAWLDSEYEKDQVDCRDLPEGPERQECYMAQGEKIYEAKGCKQCHSLDGSAGTGPTFQGMWGQTRNFTDGTSGKVDENYVRESVLDPMAKIRAGFNPVMPTFKGKLKDKDIDALNNWMKSL